MEGGSLESEPGWDEFEWLIATVEGEVVKMVGRVSSLVTAAVAEREGREELEGNDDGGRERRRKGEQVDEGEAREAEAETGG